MDELLKLLTKESLTEALRFKRENSTISRLVKKYKHTGKTERSAGSGRKPKTSKKEDHYILNAVKKNRKITCSEIKLDLNLTNISKWTISRRIKASGDFFSGKQIKKPFVSEINRKKRLKWCIEHKDWTCEYGLKLSGATSLLLFYFIMVDLTVGNQLGKNSTPKHARQQLNMRKRLMFGVVLVHTKLENFTG